jgi:hypothetical protein
MKKVAILFAGESRTNSLSNNKYTTEMITDSYKKYFFTDSFRHSYDYDIFICTDDINIEKTLNFFGNVRVKNIYLMNTQKHLYSVNNEIHSFDFVLNNCKKMHVEEHKFHENGLHQFYKCYVAYSILSNYNQEYDYIIRSRLDVEIMHDVQTQIETLEKNDSAKIISAWDTFAIGKPDIMNEYLSIINKFGSFNFSKSNHVFTRNIISIEKYNEMKRNKREWAYSPEIQLFECLFEYCAKHNYVIDDTIIGVNDMISIIRYDEKNKVFTKRIFENL